MRRVVILAEAAEDIEAARDFYDAQQPGIGDYCADSLVADIESLALQFIAQQLKIQLEWVAPHDMKPQFNMPEIRLDKSAGPRAQSDRAIQTRRRLDQCRLLVRSNCSTSAMLPMTRSRWIRWYRLIRVFP
jgi:hypothetical protein